MDEQFQNLPIFGISMVFQVVEYWKFFNFPIWEIQKTCTLKKFKNSQLRNFQKILSLTNLGNHQISEIVQIKKFINFQNFTI